MDTPKTILATSSLQWLQQAKQFQQLQIAVVQLGTALGLPRMESCVLILTEDGVLTVQATAALAARLRHIQPELFHNLVEQGWAIRQVSIAIVARNDSLSQQVHDRLWVNKNEQKYGKHTSPTAEQRARLLKFIHPKK